MQWKVEFERPLVYFSAQEGGDMTGVLSAIETLIGRQTPTQQSQATRRMHDPDGEYHQQRFESKRHGYVFGYPHTLGRESPGPGEGNGGGRL